MKYLILITVFFHATHLIKAQKVYSVDKDFKADVKVFVEKKEYAAAIPNCPENLLLKLEP